MNILDQLADYARLRVREDQAVCSPDEMHERALALPKKEHAFRNALSHPGLSFICEIKKASPSKGLISPDFPYLQIAREYESAGADAVSCLTEPRWFLGSDEIFREVRETISLPMIRKDFTVDGYQIDQARVMGADAVLLICTLLTPDELSTHLEHCESLGLDALVETHDASEIDMAVSAGAKIIGVNNRNLKDFSVDFSNAARLREQIPSDCLFVAESGVSSPDDAAQLAGIGADAVLIGEMLMRSADKSKLLAALREAGNHRKQ